jgi:hypothetical protein
MDSWLIAMHRVQYNLESRKKSLKLVLLAHLTINFHFSKCLMMLWKFHFVLVLSIGRFSDEKPILVTTNVPSFIHFNLIHFCFSKFTPSIFYLISSGGGGGKRGKHVGDV